MEAYAPFPRACRSKWDPAPGLGAEDPSDWKLFLVDLCVAGGVFWAHMEPSDPQKGTEWLDQDFSDFPNWGPDRVWGIIPVQ